MIETNVSPVASAQGTHEARHETSASQDLITVAPMRLEHVQHVSRLERRCYPNPWSSSVYVTEIGNPSAYYSVAQSTDGTVVGFAGMWVIMQEVHITTIAVNPDMRRRGIGELLLMDLLDTGRRRGGRRASLEVREHNLAAHKLYLKLGFVDVAMRRRYYTDNGENALIMWINDLRDPDFLKLLEKRRADLR